MRWGRILAVLLCLSLLTGCPQAEDNKETIYLAKVDALIDESVYNPSNNCQSYSSCHLVVRKGSVYKLLLPGNYLGTVGDYAYYTVFRTDESNPNRLLEDLFSYCFESGESSLLTTVSAFSFDTSYAIWKNDRIYIPDDGSYHVLQDGRIVDCTLQQIGYAYGDSIYYVKEADDGKHGLYQNSNGQEQLLLSGRNSLILLQTNAGLVVHREMCADVLYGIDEETGSLNLLYSIDGIDPKTAVNVWGDYVFLSFVRYEKVSESGKGYDRFINDTQSGTYRIDLRNGEILKISNGNFDGLHVFTQNVIYASDEDGRITKMDFEGNPVE